MERTQAVARETGLKGWNGGPSLQNAKLFVR
jgi:hypothetical protein